MVPIIFEGVKLYKAVYNLHLYTLPGLSGVAIRPLGSCQSWESYEYSFTTFPIKKIPQYGPRQASVGPRNRLQSQQVGSRAAPFLKLVQENMSKGPDLSAARRSSGLNRADGCFQL